MRKLKYIGVLLLVSIMAKTNAQVTDDLRINEVMLINTENYVDKFGQHTAWIEIMNIAHYSVSLENYYLTNDPNNLKKYRVPTGDPTTQIVKRNFTVLFANGHSEHGALYLNFTLDSTHRFIALVSPDGRTILDSITLPLMGPNQVYSRTIDGSGEWEISDKTTPASTNQLNIVEASRSEIFSEFDPYGLILALIAMSVVFVSLILLYRVFSRIGQLNQWNARRKSAKLTAGLQREEEVPGEVFAAISTALYLHETDQHDYESTIITIERVSRRYSPWSSKIYGLREMPQRTVAHGSKK